MYDWLFPSSHDNLKSSKTSEEVQSYLGRSRFALLTAMKATRMLSMYSARLTLFTRANCSLCDIAKANVAEVRKKRTVDYSEIDVMAVGQTQWKDKYEFDTPVLHVERIFHTYSKPNIVSDPWKLMHRFTAEEVDKLVDEAEQGIA